MLQEALDAVVVIETGDAYCAGAGVRSAHGAYIVTAYHCVANGGRPHVRWRDGTLATGRVVARSPRDDLALIAVADTGWRTLTLRPDTAVQGEEAWGLGHPFGLLASGKLAGLLEWSVSHGVVSAAGGHLVQTDAALNPGNSGGPLVDANGLLLGVVSRKLRADNLAFVSTAANVQALLAEVDAEQGTPVAGEPAPGARGGAAAQSAVGPALGGSYGVGLYLAAERRTWLGGEAWIDVRDRMVVTGALGVAPAEDWSAHASMDLTLRQRIGRGALTAVLDVGPQLCWSGAADADGAWVDGALDPALGGRIGFNHLSLGAWWHPIDPRVTVTLGLEWPGKIGVF